MSDQITAVMRAEIEAEMRAKIEAEMRTQLEEEVRKKLEKEFCKEKKEVNEQSEQMLKIMKEIKAIQGDINTKEKELNSSEEELKQKISEIDNLNRKTEALRMEIKKLNEELNKLTRQVQNEFNDITGVSLVSSQSSSPASSPANSVTNLLINQTTSTFLRAALTSASAPAPAPAPKQIKKTKAVTSFNDDEDDFDMSGILKQLSKNFGDYGDGIIKSPKNGDTYQLLKTSEDNIYIVAVKGPRDTFDVNINKRIGWHGVAHNSYIHYIENAIRSVFSNSDLNFSECSDSDILLLIREKNNGGRHPYDYRFAKYDL